MLFRSGAVNAGIVVLGKRFTEKELANPEFYILCSEYFSRLGERVGTPDCGKVHGGKHLANNFRRAILTGKTLKCIEILNHGAEILSELGSKVQQNEFSYSEKYDLKCYKTLSDYHIKNGFHCCESTVTAISYKTGLNIKPIKDSCRGFCGGIGLNGTMCGAISGAVMCLGLHCGVDLGKSTYTDSLKISFHALLKSDGVFRDEKLFKPAELYKYCIDVYKTVEQRYGSTHCLGLLGLKLNSSSGIDGYINSKKLELCRDISETVIEKVNSIIKH